ncbi:nuclease-related domain-containing protein [Isoptericola croceus]|uniref:nuclease-related domain-containing protein n=1 Tax=Isoptericola croceus TaxID=3031406 RepID=UPI0023F98D59|nr:nuclease-related domain-containing protein [Isoptericola croceus]
MSVRVLPEGLVLGTPGGGLNGDVSWAVNADVARVGRDGEVRTAAILDGLARRPGGPTVLHDLSVPTPGSRANFDHVVVCGLQVLVFDSKVWRPGRYWTLAGTTRRGLERVPHADKATGRFIVSALRTYLEPVNRYATVAPMRLVVWPSSDRARLRVGTYRGAGGVRATTGTSFASRPPRMMRRRRAGAADDVVAALAQLLPAPVGPPPGADRHDFADEPIATTPSVAAQGFDDPGLDRFA